LIVVAVALTATLLALVARRRRALHARRDALDEQLVAECLTNMEDLLVEASVGSGSQAPGRPGGESPARRLEPVAS
jgi:hypothetical protein